MALPIIEKIAVEITDRLSTLEDYTVVRPDREGTNVSPVDRLIVLRQMPSTQNDALSQHGNPAAIALDCVLMCICHVRNLYVHESEYDSACNQAATDIIGAITNPVSSPSTWYTFDGNAINCRIGANTPYISSEGVRAGVVVPLLITYRVSENDHTEARP
jgi:hypothetical protein